MIDGPISDSAALDPGFNRQDHLGYFWWLIEDRYALRFLVDADHDD